MRMAPQWRKLLRHSTAAYNLAAGIAAGLAAGIGFGIGIGLAASIAAGIAAGIAVVVLVARRCTQFRGCGNSSHCRHRTPLIP